MSIYIVVLDKSGEHSTLDLDMAHVYGIPCDVIVSLFKVSFVQVCCLPESLGRLYQRLW